MSYIFKVGDKGSTTSGIPYEVVFIDTLAAIVVARLALDSSTYGTALYSLRGKAVDMERGSLQPPKITVYANIYTRSNVFMYDSPEEAKRSACGSAVAVAVPITYTPRS